MSRNSKSKPLITLRLLRELKRCGKSMKVADSNKVELSGIDLLIRTLALRFYLEREVFQSDEERVGIFLPPMVPTVAANFAIALAGRVAVNLNYTLTADTLNYCCKTAKLKHVITSRKFLEKVPVDIDCPLVFLEDVRDKITIGDKLFAFLHGKLRSAESLHRYLGLDNKSSKDPLTIIFTSGSTGTPKGVVLTADNIDSNIDGINGVIHLHGGDTIVGVLPFFHSFGYTVTLWTANCLPCRSVYHFSPLEARPIGKLAEKYGATVLLATPTFLRSYIRRVEPQEFSALEVVVVGAEKMPSSLADEFEQKFGVRPVEGYGSTELSPVVCVNIPPTRSRQGDAPGLREGSVGRPFAGIEARVVAVDEDTPLKKNEPGLLEIRGPNVMQGYLNEPEKTQEVMHDDWYRTGDMAMIDDDGFIHITGRLSRFSKIAGEMVPHIQIEDAITEFVGTTEEGKPRVAVTAVPDEKRGERLVVLYTEIDKSRSEVIQSLRKRGLPNLFLPSEDSFYQVDEIPLLGSGKLDLKALKEKALVAAGAE